ncbi:tyrosine-type recombinase/integrase [Paenibacillus sp. HWE-109]|nr:tyrosine-type recombinase/integrase [Paenibacillus sp. HWE-109]UKS29623.1 tyrosine-type recombinase/integrase [Paenibacillus sp. HWE-109]
MDKRIPKFLIEEDVIHLKISYYSNREHALLEFLYCTGCRVGEVQKINLEDINWENCSAIVNGKGSKQREVYFTTECKVWLKRYLDSRNDTCKALFVTETNPIRRLAIPTIRWSLKKLARRGDITANVKHMRSKTANLWVKSQMFPDSSARFCTSYLVRDVYLKYARTRSENILCITGERHEESSRRAGYSSWSISDATAETKGRHVYNFRPILHLKKFEVSEWVRAAGVKEHIVYSYVSRVSYRWSPRMRFRCAAFYERTFCLCEYIKAQINRRGSINVIALLLSLYTR